MFFYILISKSIGRRCWSKSFVCGTWTFDTTVATACYL